MPTQNIPIWKQAPFLRLLIPLVAGILFQWQCTSRIGWDWIFFLLLIICLLLFRFSRPYFRFTLYWLYGILLNGLLFFLGALLTGYRDLRIQKDCIQNNYQQGDILIAQLDEEPLERGNSFKAVAAIQTLIRQKKAIHCRGFLLLYFLKNQSKIDSKIPGCGELVTFSKAPLPIANSGNPSAFDFKQACLFQQIYGQVFLKDADFICLSNRKKNGMHGLLSRSRQSVLDILKRFIPGKSEAGLAEALLIGYKNDLERALVQSYSQTGVVHIIAISGLHLALIYSLIRFFLKPLTRRKTGKWVYALLMLTSIWFFSILSGASPSVLRSALMFTCILAGETLSKHHSIYNSLSASAFLLLCYNPFWLWDIGFQLSYAAVFSIVLFMKPIHHLLEFPNRYAGLLWKSIAVSLAAQLLTAPLCIYYFHQFPNYFLAANLVAVPLSSLILVGEIGLCAVGWIPGVAAILGSLLGWLIHWLNAFIGFMAHLPYAVWDSLQITKMQCLCIYLAIACGAYFFFQKNRFALWVALLFFLALAGIRSLSIIRSTQQEFLIVYQIPHQQAIDCVWGRKYFFMADSSFLINESQQSFFLKPSRISFRLSEPVAQPTAKEGFLVIHWKSKTALILDHPVDRIPVPGNHFWNVVVVSHNAVRSIRSWSAFAGGGIWVFDSSNSPDAVNRWKGECEQLGLPYYSVADKGAFVMNMD